MAEDAAGNMTKIPKPTSWTSHFDLTYDAWNRLVEVKDGYNTVQQNQYDGLGRRVVRSVYASGSLDHKVHYYYNDRWQLLEEFIEVSGTINEHPQSSYLWHPYYIDALALRLYDESVDGNADTQYYLHDANYNVTSVWDGSQALERYSYSPYGEVTFLNPDYSTKSSQTTGSGNTHFFTGRERDSETGLQLNRNRFYASDIGRWSSRDQSEYVDSYNLYLYGLDSPVLTRDPNGDRCVKCSCACQDGHHMKNWTVTTDCDMRSWGENTTYKQCCFFPCYDSQMRGLRRCITETLKVAGAEPCENPPTQYCTIWDVCHRSTCAIQCAAVAAACGMACAFIGNPLLVKLCQGGCTAAGVVCAATCQRCKLP